MVIDRCGDRVFRHQIGKYLKRKINTREAGGNLIKKVKMEASHSNNLLQMADMVCGAVGRCFNSNREGKWEFRNLIKHRELNVQVWPTLRQ
ncbi:MAG: DUF3800 domain-containing protein [Acidobacteria bacterium]|nr:DUF3800 domain-containing protein [Acidobacteriota bacterium]